MDLSGNRFEEFPVEHDTFRNLTQLRVDQRGITKDSDLSYNEENKRFY